jgi:signal peptidase I
VGRGARDGFWAGNAFVGNLIRTALAYAVVVAGIMGAAWLFKGHLRAYVDPTDGSMDVGQYPPGNYTLQSLCTKAEDFKGGDGGDVVAYWVPGKPEGHRVARVIGVAGDKISIERQKPGDTSSLLVVNVNGKVLSKFSFERDEMLFPEITVPRGCLFLMADKPIQAADSLTIGPVPLYCILGKVNK